MPTTIITHIQNIVPTTQVKIITTLPKINTTVPEIIPTTIIPEKCKYGIEINYTSSYSNLSNDDIYHITRKDIVSFYCLNGSSVLITGSNGFNFQVTSTKNEIKSFSSNYSSINLGECENILKETYNIDKNMSLILLKFMKKDTKEGEQTFQYEIIHPITGETLNKSLCENTTVDVYVPFILDEEKEELYNNLLNQGYDPLDLNDKFYREICTPYTSENGTDVLLDDREEFVYSSLVNASLCPDGCDYSEYYTDKKFIKCECGTNNTEIVTLDIEHLSGNNAYKSFLSTMKSTNYKVMRCYNLVFNFKIFCHNYGSIITLALFGVYIVFMVYYCIKDISPIKVQVSKLIFEDEENLKEAKNYIRFNTKKKSKINIKEKAAKENNPPKKGKVRKSKQIVNNLVTENYEFIQLPKKSNQKIKQKNKNKELTKPSVKNLITDEINEIKSQETKVLKSKKIEVVKNIRKNEDNEMNSSNEFKNKDKLKDSLKYNNLDDFELNNLEYIEACELDHRSFCKTYWSVLMREHIALLTFFAWKDYNLFYIKIEKFFILFCTDMTMNGLFFVHESMHKKYTNEEDFTFVQKIPQLLFTLIVSHIIEVLLCFLSMTDTHVYEIKALPKNKNNGEKILNILDTIKKKLVTFFVVTFLFFLFYWYFISAFCAVYQNTQKIFLRDSLISFLTNLIDPFFIYGFTTILRSISLCRCLKKRPGCGCIYKLSDLIPIF